MKTIRQLVVLAVSLGLVALALGGVAGAQGANNTPDNRVLVLIENLEEAYSAGVNETSDMFEVPNFVDRVMSQAPNYPDVMLMQELNYRSSGYVAREMTRRTGQRYVVVVRPPVRPNEVNGGRSIHTETSIIINNTTMRIVNRGGYIATSYPRSAKKPGERRIIKRHAHALVEERGTGMRMPLMSVHFVRTSDMKSLSLSNYWRGEWAQQIEKFMQTKYGADATSNETVIGGDFNMDRCVSGSFQSCKVARFWRIFTSQPHEYGDALYPLKIDAGVDIIFTQSRVFGGNWDENGKFSDGDRQRYYSDHRFRWATVGS